MANCNQCGNPMTDDVKFCPSCGTPSVVAAPEQPEAVDNATANPGAQTTEQKVDEAVNTVSEKFSKLNETSDTTTDYDKADIEQNKVMAVLSYFGILVLVPILAAKDSLFARFHANQGLVLFIVMIGWLIVDSILTAILRAILWRSLGLWSIYSLCSLLLNLVYIAFAVLAVIGIVNALNGKAKELPLIGRFKLLK